MRELQTIMMKVIIVLMFEIKLMMNSLCMILRKATIVYNFGLSECNRDKLPYFPIKHFSILPKKI